MNTRIIARAAALATVAAAGLLGPAGPARALTVDMTCSAAFELDFTPPLTATQTTSTAVGRAGIVGCLPLTVRAAGLQSAAVTATGQVTSSGLAPCNLLLTITGTGRFLWNTGQQSHFVFTINTDPTAGTITLSATITSGRLAGDTITAVPVLAHPNVDCAVTGLTRLTSELAALTFTT